jgi:ribosomal protein L37E
VIEMSICNLQGNWIKCGKCGTEFDLDKNRNCCPLCGFGKVAAIITEKEKTASKIEIEKNYLSIPPHIELKKGKPKVDEQTRVWGSWVMFNDFFAPKFLARRLAWKLKDERLSYALLSDFIVDAKETIQKHDLSRFKGFPSKVGNDSAIRRLVHHFLKTATLMGFFDAKIKEGNSRDVWNENWDNILISLTMEGLNFAQLKNYTFDEKEEAQVLTVEEKKFIINHLRQIDMLGYREYSTLKEVYEFLRKGNNGNRDLWNWFENNQMYQGYLRRTSVRAKYSEEAYIKQLRNYAKTFASSKVSLLRELGLVKNKRNDYTIVGEFE